MNLKFVGALTKPNTFWKIWFSSVISAEPVVYSVGRSFGLMTLVSDPPAQSGGAKELCGWKEERGRESLNKSSKVCFVSFLHVQTSRKVRGPCGIIV